MLHSLFNIEYSCQQFQKLTGLNIGERLKDTLKYADGGVLLLETERVTGLSKSSEREQRRMWITY